jgi:hypothetical protein
MNMKTLLAMMALVFLGISANASQALAPGDQVVRDFSKSTGFRQWVGTLTKHSIPGDYEYIEQTFKAYPNLTKSDSLPKLNFEKDTFQIREGLSQVTLQYFPGQPHTFSINGQRVEFGAYELASQKMRKILSVMTKGGQASHFLLLPVAWAQDSHMPTKTSLAVLAVTSATTTVQLPVTSPHLAQLTERVQDTTAWKNFSSKNNACLQKIREVEKVVYDQEQLDFKSMECTSMGLNVHLGGVDEHGYARDFVVEKDGFYVEQSPGKNSIISRYSLVQPDTMTKSSDDPVALSSSPAQRDQMGGEFQPVSDADRETMFRYMGAATPVVRGFCSSECAGTLKAYWKVLQTAEVKAGSGTPSRGTH